MKKSLILVLSLAVVLAFAGMVLAQTNPPAQTPAGQTTPPEKAVVKPEVKTTAKTVGKPAVVVKQKKIMGVVVSVDAVANTIVIKWKDVDKTFKVDPAAKIMMAGKACTLADIQKDAKVTVRYKVVGKDKVALEIM